MRGGPIPTDPSYCTDALAGLQYTVLYSMSLAVLGITVLKPKLVHVWHGNRSTQGVTSASASVGTK